jgi:transglutaminase-like putative cysteine protease
MSALPRAAAALPARWLCDTPALQLGHPRLQVQVHKLTQLQCGPSRKALAVFQFVRGLPFKLVAESATATAPGVLRGGEGDSHTKGLLFVAMLRVLGIPARLRFVALPPAMLRGLIDTRSRPVAHAVAQAWLGARWVQVDAYCVDPRLALAARARLMREGSRAGWGVHLGGQVSWDGVGDCLAHGFGADAASQPVQELGLFDDPSQWAGGRLAPFWAVALANRRLASLRQTRA